MVDHLNLTRSQGVCVTPSAHPEALLVPLAPALEVADKIDDQLLFPNVLQLHELVGVQIATAPAEEAGAAFGGRSSWLEAGCAGSGKCCV